MENDGPFEYEVDPAHLEILSQGVTAWNQWRLDNPTVYPYLGRVYFNEIGGKKKSSFRVQKRYGIQRDLSGIDLSNLVLHDANFSGIKMHNANFENAILGGAYFFDSDVNSSNFKNSMFYGTTFVNTDLSNCEGLETCRHEFASYLDYKTLLVSGDIPEQFLKGCGLPEWQIVAAKLYGRGIEKEQITEIVNRISDLRLHQAPQKLSLFISYSHDDGKFVDKVEELLREEGIVFWRDIRDGKAGRLEKQVDLAMKENPIVLLILSENSVNSDWVEHEAESARELERTLNRDVLCPVALDEAWKKSDWDMRLRRQIQKYNILDFSKWEEDEESLRSMFKRLVEGLDLFY